MNNEPADPAPHLEPVVCGEISKAIHWGYEARLVWADDNESSPEAPPPDCSSWHFTLWGARRGSKWLVKRYDRAAAFNQHQNTTGA